MRLGSIIDEDRLLENRARRESLGLPWLVFDGSKYELGDAILEAEAKTGLDVKLGLWPFRQMPKDVLLVGKYIADPADPELPLYVSAAASRAIAAKTPAEPLPSRAASVERVLVRIATRLIVVEKEARTARVVSMITLFLALLACTGLAVVLLQSNLGFGGR